MHEWFVVILWFFGLKIVQLVLTRISKSPFANRKLLHILIGFSVIPLTALIKHWYIALVPVSIIFSANAASNLRDFSRRSAQFQFYVFLGVILPVALIMILWNQQRMQTIVIAVLVMTIGDAAAAVAGRLWGRHWIRHGKTLEGAFCNLLVSFATVFVATQSLPAAIGLSVTAALVEAVVPGIWDNPAVLVVVLLLLYYFNIVQ